MSWEVTQSVQINGKDVPIGLKYGDYRIAKFGADEGALCTLYGAWFHHESLGYFDDFADAKDAIRKHREANGTD